MSSADSKEQPLYGPDNPHPLSRIKTEIVWEGKYDSAGHRVAPLRVALPFQPVETVNETAQERQRMLAFEARGVYEAKEWRNRLIWGDKKYVLPSLLPEFAGKVNLIYIDPPFNVGADFSFTATVPDNPDTPEDDSFNFNKEPSIIEHKAYRDTWGRGMDSYLQWFYETAVLLHELLHESGSLYVHLDWHVGHYAKCVLDEVFGLDNFANEIVWHYKRWPAPSQSLQKMHDTIFLYGKSTQRFFHVQLQDLTEGTNRRWGGQKSKVEYTNGVRQVTQMTDEKSPGTPQDDVWNIPVVNSQAIERVEYATQKPETLLERIIKSSSNEGDLILDCFCGSGTTVAVAEKLKRHWIACDLGRFAIHTARKRLLDTDGVRPFIVQNLGKYERQLWQAGEFGNGDGPAQTAARQRAYVGFILGLYQATPLNGHTWLHGVKAGRMAHVGSVDAPVSVGDVTQIAAEFKRAIGTGKDAPKTNGVDVLGWEFAFEMNEVAKQQAAAANIHMRFLRIPHDAMDKRAVQQGDIRFFELAALAVKAETTKRVATLRLTDFVIPPDDVPEDVRRAVKHWSQWIDYWAVDWNNKGDTFHNEWQTYRKRKEPKLDLETTHTYAEPGEYKVVVKVIDILGNDTTKTIMVKVK